MFKSFYNVLAFVFCACLFSPGYAQFFPNKNYPQAYFQWPVGAKIGIVANFGELRPNHYHMGLDCQTEQKQNLPVYAAAPGYIAKVKIEPFGFGRCIYINHPNGLTTLYAHLNEFAPELEKYVTAQQYSMQSWAVFLDIPKNLFPVKKGELVAHSGSTGGSQGPHVHFEIRDTKTDKVLNPSLFNFPIPDHVAPKIIRLAVYDRSISTYEQTPRVFAVKKTGDNYTTQPAELLINADLVSFAITAFDTYDGSSNENGIYEAILYDNDKPVSGFQIDSISYTETRYLNAHIDHKLRSNGGPFLEHLSRLPGYNNSIYRSDGSDGVINLNDTSTHAMAIVVKDANGNSSTLKFSIRKNGISSNQWINREKMFYPNTLNIFENDKISFYLPENCIYDSFRFVYKELQPAQGRTIFQLMNPAIPLHTYFPVKIKDSFPVSDTGKIVMERSFKNKTDYTKATGDNGWYKASFKEFGDFQLLVDTIPPTVLPVGFRNGMDTRKQSRIVFVVTDNTEEIKRFTALLDGKWLRFSNDKGKNFVYNFDEHCAPGAHELKIIAEDQVGNITEKIFTFTR